MSCYDTIDLADGNINDQVKCWGCEMKVYHEGDTVPDTFLMRSYAIALRSSGYVIIDNCVIKKWQEDKPVGMPIYDKWGEPFDDKTVGLLSERYVGYGLEE